MILVTIKKYYVAARITASQHQSYMYIRGSIDPYSELGFLCAKPIIRICRTDQAFKALAASYSPTQPLPPPCLRYGKAPRLSAWIPNTSCCEEATRYGLHRYSSLCLSLSLFLSLYASPCRLKGDETSPCRLEGDKTPS